VAELDFPRVDRPLVSIVLLTYNDIEWIPRALQACLDNTDACYELIVVDNGSTDGTVEFLTTKTSGARLLLNNRNYGYGTANNVGAGYAVGQHLLFLNSDAFVHPGWLPPLLAALEADETVAAAAPRLLNLDGSLQLAGALLTRAGATVVYGDGDDPRQPQYGFARSVDFSAGACLLLRRSAFNEVGGFDPAFGLIYFEDADLCLALWQRGHRIVYEPRSTLTHVGGSGSEPSQLVLQLALRNRSLFERRWRALLASYPPAPLVGERRLIAARDIRSSDRILVLGKAGCAEALARTFPSARVTLAGVGAEARARLNRQIELAFDAENVLRERRFHYDVIIGEAAAMKTFGELLLHTQPQAVQIHSEHLVDSGGKLDLRRLLEAGASAGVRPVFGNPTCFPQAALG
jgi:GT2 family glycosyltransferase